MSIARRLIYIIAGLGSIVLGAACREAPPPPPPVLRLTLDHPAELQPGAGTDYPFGLALAPDGRRLVLPAAREAGLHQLWLRDLANGDLQPLANTRGAAMPFWSPDGTSVAFFADGKLRALSIADGAVSDLADAPTPRGGAWTPGGEIIYAPEASAGLKQRNADGTLVDVTSLDSGEMSHRLPQLVGDSFVVFFVRASEPARQGIWIMRRNEPASRRRLVSSEAAGIVIDDALVYASGDALVAQRIDLETLTLVGRPQLLGSTVGRGSEHQLFATAAAEVLLFGAPMSALRELRWVDTAGQPLGTLGEPMRAWDVRVAPVGSRAAIARVDPQLATLDIWTYDEQRPVPRRLSPAIDTDDSPAWSPDASQLAWVTGRRTVTVRDSRGVKPERSVQKFDTAVRVTDWAPNGRTLVLTESRANTGLDITVLDATRTGLPSSAYAALPFNQSFGAVSPDGRWLAYVSDESGREDIYADAFPKPGSRARLSMGGGTEPRWSRDGAFVYFRRGREIHRIAFSAAGDVPQALSSTRLFDAGADIRAFDVAPDGRLLLNVPAPESTPQPLTVLVNVRSLLPSAP